MRGAVMAGLATACDSGTFSGAALDSRQVRGGELFFALPGARTDGHAFVAQALAAGAAAAVVHRSPQPPSPPTATLIRVGDTYRALHDLTRAVRRQVPRRLVGLTGSVGKTTTKELLAAMLERRFRVAKSPGNLNNLLGFPVALLGIPDDTEWMVAEMGMSTPGELAAISRLARPDAALLLNVRPAHLENFGTLAAIAEAKAEIMAGLDPGALLVANADDPEVVRVARRHRGRTVWFGWQTGAEVRGRDLQILPDGGSRFVLAAGGGRQEVELPLVGRHNAENFLAAAACAYELGVPLAEIAAAAAIASPVAGRGEIHRLAAGVTVIDDSYNSNPHAVARALEAAASLPARRHWAVLGDMLELGPEAPRYHREAGRQAAAAGFAPVAGVGPLARELVAGAREAGAEAVWLADAAAAAEWAAAEVAHGDLVLVKGSRGIGLDAVVQRLLAAAASSGEESERAGKEGRC